MSQPKKTSQAPKNSSAKSGKDSSTEGKTEEKEQDDNQLIQTLVPMREALLKLSLAEDLPDDVEDHDVHIHFDIRLSARGMTGFRLTGTREVREVLSPESLSDAVEEIEAELQRLVMPIRKRVIRLVNARLEGARGKEGAAFNEG